MTFIPSTDKERQQMLKDIGVESFEELIRTIPEEIRMKQPLKLRERLSELEIRKLLANYAGKNITSTTHTCFMGGGAYDHFIPSVVDMVLSRSEFKTAYTPYQAEVSQGTLQAMYEFQSMVCAITDMEVSNASLYDGGTSLAEACLMSNAVNKKTEFVIAGTINPYYKQVMETITIGRDLTFKEFVSADGTADIEGLEKAVSENTSALIVQSPNFYGNIEDIEKLEKIIHQTSKGLLIVSACPLSMGILKTPGELNADILVGEGQALGIPISFGGPYLGLFATKKKFVRKIPGRLSGVTEDADGKRSYVLTLQTREQQIKREKATSNICTNQGLFMLAATTYMETMGKSGIKEVAEQIYEKGRYLAERISELPRYSLFNDKPFFREFLVNTPVEPSKIIEAGYKRGFLAGVDTSKFDNYQKCLLVSVTEKRTKEELDEFVEFLKTF